MPPRKYPDLAHLSPEEYYRESQKRKNDERKDYYRKRYIESQDLNRLEEKKKKLEETIVMISNIQKEGVVPDVKKFTR
jgi:hypothetical protein